MLYNRNVWVLTLGMFLLAVSYTMLVPFLPVYLLELGASEDDVALWSGSVFSITFLISAVMAPIWGRLADSKGKKLMVLRAGVCLAIGYLALGFITEPWHLFAGRAFLGFANGFMPAGMALISVSVAKEDVGKALGIYQTGNIVGGVLGPLIGGLIDSWVGMRPAFLFAGIVLTLVTLGVVFFVDEPEINSTDSEEKTIKTEDSSLWEDFKFVQQHQAASVLLGVMFLVQAILLMLHPILALYVGKLQGTLENAAFTAGTILSIGGLAGALASTPWGSLGARIGYLKVISMTIVGTGLALFAQYFAEDIWVFGTLQVFVGIFMVGVLPSLSTAIALATPEEFRGRIFGMSTMSLQFGNMMGPMISAVVTTYLGVEYVFFMTGLLLVILGANVYYRYAKREYIWFNNV